MRCAIQATVLAAAVLLCPSPASADAQADFDRAVSRYQNANYAEAAAMFKTLLSTPVDDTTEAGRRRRKIYLRARPIYVTCLLALRRESEARAAALRQLEDDPFFELPPGEFPQAVVDLFIQVEAENRQKIEALKNNVIEEKQAGAQHEAKITKLRAERVRILEKMASEEVETVRRSRWIAAIPFGVGQFQNGDPGLGSVFLVSETLALATNLSAAGVAIDALNQIAENCDGSEFEPVDGGDGRQLPDCPALFERKNTAQVVSWVSLGTFAAVGLAGIVEAQVSFEDTTVTRKKRPIPPRITPTVSVTDRGAFLGVYGRF